LLFVFVVVVVVVVCAYTRIWRLTDKRLARMSICAGDKAAWSGVAAAAAMAKAAAAEADIAWLSRLAKGVKGAATLHSFSSNKVPWARRSSGLPP
jgi:hypothetical protein